MDLPDNTPTWLLRPLPANAVEDKKLLQRITNMCADVLTSLQMIDYALLEVNMFQEYDAAANLASAQVWDSLHQFLQHPDCRVRAELVTFAERHMVPEARARIFRRLAKDPSYMVRHRVRQYSKKKRIKEVALPVNPDDNWDSSGWFRGINRPLARHSKLGQKTRDRLELPKIAKLAQLRKLLGIRSPAQLGFFLLASDKDGGPYSCFTIPKNDGSERTIAAPGTQLRWVQRRILDNILSKVPVHAAAHGFIPGRSTVTNAAAHVGAKLLLKFDLADFFPTIHYNRVVGLFASLGYAVGDARFGTDDDSKQIAPTLARLCCYTPDAYQWGTALVPQGAPTSPAISNLTCRRLDARLSGLAKEAGGVYTRYADDLTFSFKTEEPKSIGRFRWWVDQICHQEGFYVHQGKFRVIRCSQRQLVTGIVVNDELRVPREERRRFRAILHNCRKHGVALQARKHPRFGEYLRGFASYVHMVHPEEGLEFLQQVNELLGPETTES